MSMSTSARYLRFPFRLVSVLMVILVGANSAASEADPLVASSNAGAGDSAEAVIAQARRYEHGEGVTRDYRHAIELYCTAAKAGSADALYALGWIYANARGVARDDGTAQRLFVLAAEQGHVQARQMMKYVSASSSLDLPACLKPTAPPIEPREADQQQELAPAFPNGPISRIVSRLAPGYNIDPRLALAVISVESGFNIKAVSPKNAQGLMQLMPATAQRFHVKNPFDPEENIKGGLAYLRWLLAYFKGDVALVAAAYNAGERAVETYSGIPPFRETREYVQRITRLYKKATHPYQSEVTQASPIMTREGPGVVRVTLSK